MVAKKATKATQERRKSDTRSQKKNTGGAAGQRHDFRVSFWSTFVGTCFPLFFFEGVFLGSAFFIDFKQPQGTSKPVKHSKTIIVLHEIKVSPKSKKTAWERHFRSNSEPFWARNITKLHKKTKSKKRSNKKAPRSARRGYFWAARRNARASWGIMGADKTRPKIERLDIAGTLVHRACSCGESGDCHLSSKHAVPRLQGCRRAADSKRYAHSAGPGQEAFDIQGKNKNAGCDALR